MRADGGKKLRRKAAMQGGRWSIILYFSLVSLPGKRMKKTLMALGGDDTKEEVRDLLNQSDISIIGAKVFNLKANLILTKTSIFKNKTKNNLHPRQLSTIRLQLPRPPKRQSSGWRRPGEGSRSPSPWCRSRRRRPRRRWPTGSPTGSATGSRRRGP